MTTINIAGLDRAELLRRMWNHAFQQTRIVKAFGSPVRMTLEQAQEHIICNTDRYRYFDYLDGVCIKTDLMPQDDQLGTVLYDRDNGGPGTLAGIVKKLRDGEPE